MIEAILSNLDEDQQVVRLDGLDEAVIGIESSSNKLIYSAEKIMEVLQRRDGMTYGDALEHYSFNIEGAFLGEGTPIFCYDLYD